MQRNSLIILGVGISLFALFIFLYVMIAIPPVMMGSVSPFPPQYSDKELFLQPIKAAMRVEPTSLVVTGLIAPHHLLAKDLIAETFASIRNARPQTVIVMSPDHFNLGSTPVTVAKRDFNTVFGKLKTDSRIVNQLLLIKGVMDGEFFYREHGIGAELPFIKYFFPGANVVAVTIKADANEKDLNPLIMELKKILSPTSTLFVESTDFSHYLTAREANLKDKETLLAIQSGEAEKVLNLTQPDHLDSAAVLYVNMRLQQELFGAKLKILQHKNSQNYSNYFVNKTTSYFTAVFDKY